MNTGYFVVRNCNKDISYVNGTYQGNGLICRSICKYIIYDRLKHQLLSQAISQSGKWNISGKWEDVLYLAD